MSKEPKTRKSLGRKPWKTIELEMYEEVMHGLVHFSAKTTNSNTPACGIRLGANNKNSLPYLSVSTLGSVPVDYTSTGTNGINATVLAQIAAAIEGNSHDIFDGVPSSEIDEIRTIADEILATPFESGIGVIGMRLRQVIVQDAQGNDLAITPLQSAGFSDVLDERIRQRQDANSDDRKRYWKRGFLGVGGSNPQNVGRYVRAMNRPLFFSAPHDVTRTRAAHAIHHRGISLKPPHQLLENYIRWRRKVMSGAGGVMPSDVVSRDKEADFIYEIVKVISARAQVARQQLEDAVELLPGANLLADDMEYLMRGLLVPTERSMEWLREFSQRLHREILDAKVNINGEWQNLGIGEYESVRWISIIEEAL